ncbi:MAG: histidine phosphatase family protein [Patescibacteria group bacterium]|nr:histidine phosphatase family protein [Patescibacteria group bacterium]
MAGTILVLAAAARSLNDATGHNLIMGKIFLVRHGQDKDNQQGILNGKRDSELTDLGRRQAATVVEKFKDIKIEAIYCSPLKRAYDTAKIIAAELGVNEVITDESLIERDFGVLTGKPVADILKYTQKIIRSDGINYFLEVEGAESFSDLLLRGGQILEKINQQYPDSNIVIVTHGDIGKMIRAVYHNWTWQKGLETPYFDNTEVLELSDSQDKEIL